MSPAEVVQLLALVFGPLGVLGGLWSMWSTRQKPGIDKQQAEDASDKTKTDIVTARLNDLVMIINEYRTERDRDRVEYEARLLSENAARKDLEQKVVDLTARVETAEKSGEESRLAAEASRLSAESARILAKTAVEHITTLENHINQQLPPPPPPIPKTLVFGGLD